MTSDRTPAYKREVYRDGNGVEWILPEGEETDEEYQEAETHLKRVKSPSY